MIKVEKLIFDEYSVEVNPQNLRFDETSLSSYIMTEAGFYDNFGAYLALAEKNLQNREILHERLFCERFVEAKEVGASDKLAEAKAKSDKDVILMKEAINDARYIVNRLKNHLKAWDKNHDNAQSMGHMLRKQMDKINGDIYAIPQKYPDNSYSDKDVQETITSFPKIDESGFETDLSLDNLF